jgi:Cu2+-exporting ATPase
MAHELAVARLRRGGLFVRAADIWGRLLRIRKIVFDKTGTLTLDAPALRNPQTLTKLTPPAVAALSALVSHSRHPISASLRHALAGQNLFTMAGNASVEEIPGYGVKMRSTDGLEWALRRPDLAEDAEAVFTCEGTVVAKFHFTEAIRPDAVREVEMLHRRGFPIFLLSGDREEKVTAMAEALGVPANQALARCSPDDKATWMKKFGQDALFVGDGANDSLAADQSLVRGTPAVERSLLAEKADFYFLSRGLRPVRTLIETALLRRQAVMSAFTFALLYNASAVALSLGGKMNPLLAAILMPLSSVVTLLIVGWRLRDAGGKIR